MSPKTRSAKKTISSKRVSSVKKTPSKTNSPVSKKVSPIKRVSQLVLKKTNQAKNKIVELTKKHNSQAQKRRSKVKQFVNKNKKTLAMGLVVGLGAAEYAYRKQNPYVSLVNGETQRGISRRQYMQKVDHNVNQKLNSGLEKLKIGYNSGLEKLSQKLKKE